MKKSTLLITYLGESTTQSLMSSPTPTPPSTTAIPNNEQKSSVMIPSSSREVSPKSPSTSSGKKLVWAQNQAKPPSKVSVIKSFSPKTSSSRVISSDMNCLTIETLLSTTP